MSDTGNLECERCGVIRWAPVGVCPNCGHRQSVNPPHISPNVSETPADSDATGTGTIPADFSFLNIRIAPEPLRHLVRGDSRLALLLHPAAWVALPVVFALLFGSQVHRGYGQWPIFALALFAVPAAVAYFNRSALRAALQNLHSTPTQVHWGWVLVGVAVVLRIALHGFLPLEQTIFEEIETGKNAYDLVVLGYDLPLEFRFTNIMGALGFLFGDFNLQSLRFFFQLSGALSVLVMALALRRIEISWPVTLLVVFTMASLRYLVVGNGSAHEILAGTLFQTLMLWCLIGNFTSKNRKMAWAALAGLFAGILMYEHISYKPAILIAPAWWLWQAWSSRDIAVRSAALKSGATFMLCLSLVALPTIYDIASGPGSSQNFSGLAINIRDAKFGITSGQPFALLPFSKDIAFETLQYFKLIFGWPDAWSDGIHRVPGNAVVLPLAGALFLIAFCHAIVRPALNGLTVISALAIFATIMTLTVVSSYFNPSRIIGVFPLLFIMTALTLEPLHRTLASRRVAIPGNPGIWITLFAIAITLGNVMSIKVMANHPFTIAIYDRGKYNVCRTIANEDRQYRQVLVFGQDGAVCRPDHEGWLFPDIPTRNVQRIDHLPSPDQLPARTLVLAGTGSPAGMDGTGIENFVQLATATSSVHTLHTQTNTAGNTSAMTFCYQCDDASLTPTRQSVGNAEPSPPVKAVGGAAIVPDPAGLDIRAAPTEHHLFHLVSTQSAVIIPSSDDAALVLHNDTNLLGRDGCNEARRSPEGDTRILLILPDPGVETPNPFYLVGCSPGEATLQIMSEGDLLNVYSVMVSDP